VAVLFLDTSALVRRYDPAEPGATDVRRLCQRSAGHTLLISRLACVETASAFNRNLRQGQFDVRLRDRYWRLFQQHLRGEYRVMLPDHEVYQQAQRLLFSHPLRACDAVQLAGALGGKQLLGSLATDFRFCTADRVQAQAGRDEGLTVELIA
jgi:predicted nucleic acid-binding protein